ncbi:MAG TPA: cation:proton antiporter [Candidatus Norongarragalinales archaeon]|nr:cation:proton antiporter [Candidatus Norongarragalinales archaeon]
MATFVEIGVLVFFAAVAGVLSTRLKIPPVLGLLTAGVVIGPHALGIVSEGGVIAGAAEIGSMLLLFSIGAEFSLSKLREYGVRAFSIGLVKLALVFWLSYEFSLLLALDSITSLYVAAILAISSTALTIKLLEQKGMVERKEVPFLIAALVVEDLFAVFALAFFSAVGNQSTVNLEGLVSSAALSIGALGVAYFLVLQALRELLKWLTEFESQETFLFLSLAIAVGFSYLAQTVGLTTSIGAFLAGSVVASLPKGKTPENAVSPFALAFTSVFFLAVGMLVDINAVAANWWLIFWITLASLAFKFVGTGVSMYFNGFSASSSAFSAAAMLATGEFSLVIASQAPNASIDLVGMTSVIVFISSIATSILVSRHEQVEAVSRAIMPKMVQRVGRQVADQIHQVQTSLITIPNALVQVYADLKRQAATTFLVLAVAGVALLFFSNQKINVFGTTFISGFWLVLLVSVAVISLPLRALLKDLGQIFSVTQKRLESKASVSNWFSLLILMALLLFLPFLLPSSQTPGLFRVGVLLLVGGLVVLQLLRLKPERRKKKSSLMFKDAAWKKP